MKQRQRGIPFPPGGIITAVYIGFIALPLVALFVRAISSYSIWDSLTNDVTLTALRLSLVTSAISMIIVVAAGIPIARYLARRTGAASRLIDVFIDIPLVLPPIVAGLAMLMAFGRSGILGGRVGVRGHRAAVHDCCGDRCAGLCLGAVLCASGKAGIPGGAGRTGRDLADAWRFAVADVLAHYSAARVAVDSRRPCFELGTGDIRIRRNDHVRR